MIELRSNAPQRPGVLFVRRRTLAGIT